MIIKKNNTGFTLIELIVTIAVAGVIAALAIPTFSSWLPNIRLEKAARYLYADLQQAKMQAVKTSGCTQVDFTTVTFPATGGFYTGFIDDGGTATAGGIRCNGIQDGDEIALFGNSVTTFDSRTTMGSGVSLVIADDIGTANGVVFNSYGLVRGSQSGNIVMQNNQGRWYRVRVKAAGGTQIEVSLDSTIGTDGTWK